MKVIIDGTKAKKCTCPYCNSLLEYDESDVSWEKIYSVFHEGEEYDMNADVIICAVCNSKITIH